MALPTSLMIWNQVRCGSRRGFHKSVSTTKASQQSTASRDTRLAGRLRFYKQVGVTPVSPPWVGKEGTTGGAATIESPISAGVDGTDSASGVHHVPKELSSLKYILSPRTPGKAGISEENSANEENWFGVTLDGRILKSPMGQTLALPSKHLAFAVAGEWDAQKKYLNPSQMPLMTLACTALDQVATDPDVYRKYSLNYLPTDTVSGEVGVMPRAFKPLKSCLRLTVLLPLNRLTFHTKDLFLG